ncbi:MAG: tetratricopeptide repeat protein [Rhodobiaceae bacterium]|nr:tetratricopeptide repeat protein [Rhodobiaceae bacterium]
MSDDLIFREVDEDLRHEQLHAFWKRFGPYILGGAALIIVGVAGYKGWTAYSASQAASSGARYEEALRDVNGGKEGDALKALGELAQTGSGDYPDLARLTAAAAKSRTGDVDGALADYDALAANAADPLMRDLARLKAAMAVLDSSSQEEVARRVGDLAATPGPWRNLAREILGLAAYKAGNLALAGSFFEDILADAGASAEIRQRAEVMVSLMAPQRLDGEKKPEEKAAQ